MKLAVVGGGSTYTPEVIDGLVRLRAQLPVGDLFLHDTNAQRLETVAGLARRMLARAGPPGAARAAARHRPVVLPPLLLRARRGRRGAAADEVARRGRLRDRGR